MNFAGFLLIPVIIFGLFGLFSSSVIASVFAMGLLIVMLLSKILFAVERIREELNDYRPSDN